MAFTVQEFFQFLEDIPFGQVAAAVEAGGLNVAADVSAGEAIVASVVKDFFGGAATPTTAASNAAAAAGVPAAAPKTS
jgi:hypothetical protein